MGGDMCLDICCHATMTKDSLDVSKINVNSDGNQWVIHDGYQNDKIFEVNLDIGIPKGLKVALQECGVDNTNMTTDQMKKVLKQHPDFSDKKCRTERLLVEEHNYTAYFMLKYHCELNLIEWV